jgi:pimeloyl-ACP methyl ester carboxylesterase
MAVAMGASPTDIDVEHAKVLAESGTATIEQGLVDKAWIKAIARVMENISPLQGRLALMVIKQAYVYIKRPHVADRIDAVVRPALAGDEPMIVVSHSLGTVVCYKLLREFAANHKPRNVPLFVTLGSPLSIDAVKRSFPSPRLRPQAIQRWLNGVDRNDFVALRNVLDATTFGPGPVENISTIDNRDDPHAIVRYLQNPEIALSVKRSADRSGEWLNGRGVRSSRIAVTAQCAGSPSSRASPDIDRQTLDYWRHDLPIQQTSFSMRCRL